MEITLEQVERLREKANVSYEEAKAVLEEANGSLLDALILLERRGKIGPGGGQSASYSTRPGAGSQTSQAFYPGPAEEPEEEGERSSGLWHFIQGLLRRGLENSLEVWRREELLVSIPLLIAILLVVVAFWICLPLVLIGLLAGCQLRLAGPDLDQGQAGEAVNRAARTVGDTVQHLRDQAQQYFHENHGDKK